MLQAGEAMKEAFTHQHDQRNVGTRPRRESVESNSATNEDTFNLDEAVGSLKAAVDRLEPQELGRGDADVSRVRRERAPPAAWRVPQVGPARADDVRHGAIAARAAVASQNMLADRRGVRAGRARHAEVKITKLTCVSYPETPSRRRSQFVFHAGARSATRLLF